MNFLFVRGKKERKKKKKWNENIIVKADENISKTKEQGFFTKISLLSLLEKHETNIKDKQKTLRHHITSFVYKQA